ncbi:hypothetical protein ABZ612_13395 [Streptomyces avermitilis]|uniref:hypothetical protein n=1 Tax=Streptomyces avermitilis TaxID=33903 RepID=UPI0033E895B5
MPRDALDRLPHDDGLGMVDRAARGELGRAIWAHSWQIADPAARRLDAFREFGRDDADPLAGALAAREAGADVTDTEGRPWRAGAPGFLAASPAPHPQLLRLLRLLGSPTGR